MTLFRYVCSATLIIGLAACGGSGSEGPEVVVNAAPDQVAASALPVYNGPPPASDDVQNFRLNVWDNLARADRCANCHVQGEQSPTFARNDDINLAFAEANTVVDLQAPALSRLATFVGEGHNCWTSQPSVCQDIITNFIEAWANASGIEPTEIILTPPPEFEVGVSRNFPAEPGDFATTVYPVLTTYCAGCHSEESAVQQQPFIASPDIDVAYQAARTRINLTEPNNSRLVVRLRNEAHNCWSDCSADADTMRDAIQAFVESIPLTEVDEDLIISRALGLPDGIVASSGGRVDTNAVALYEFATGAGSVAFDTSGVDPALDLNLSGNVSWIGSRGIRIIDGKAQGSTSASRKLHTLLTSTGEYSIEAWVVPDNVVQDGPARIVTYSGGADVRNFMLGQTTYDYDFASRSSNSDANGMPLLSTPSADEILQATLQHVVVNFDPVSGRSIYVNGELVASDPEPPGNLNDWDPTFAFAVGNEVDNQQLWAGSVRLLAVHNRVLSEEAIVGNFEAGVGERFFLLFGVSHLIDVPEAYLMFEVAQFDDYSYLFSEPRFISLDSTATLSEDLVIEGLRIGVNGREVQTGQTYANVSMTISDDNYTPGQAVVLSELGSLVPVDQGPDSDQFFVTFDRIGEQVYERPVEVPAAPTPATPAGEQSDIGVRTFDEVNFTLSELTSVPVTEDSVVDTFNIVRQQLPTVESASGFLSSHQSGVMQLTVSYCSALVSNQSLRSAYFPGFDFSAPFATAFADNNRDLIIAPMLAALLASEFDLGGGNVSSLQTAPEPIDLEVQLSELVDDMASSNDTQATVIATCAAAFGSALMLVQ